MNIYRLKKLLLFTLLCLCSLWLIAQDLIITDLHYEARPYKRLEPMTIRVSVQNISEYDRKNPYVAHVYFSKNRTWEQDTDIYAGTLIIKALKAGQTLTQTCLGRVSQFGIPVSPGAYYMIVRMEAEETLSGIVENNDSFASKEKVTVLEGGFDIAATSWHFNSADTLHYRSDLNMTINFVNLGLDDLKSVSYDLYLSKDARLDATDHKIGWTQYADFNWRKSVVDHVRLPLAYAFLKGEYQLLLKIHTRGQETRFVDQNMSNNILSLGKLYFKERSLTSPAQSPSEKVLIF